MRRVPADWEHPRGYEYDPKQFKPLLDNDFDEEAREWYANAELWTKGEHPDQNRDKFRIRTLRRTPGNSEWKEVSREDFMARYRWFHEWGPSFRRQRDEYMAHWIGDRARTHFQWYENTSEGTPLSPVFATEAELMEWLEANDWGSGWNE